jgi:DNA-binding Xre family transcriptional regulator
MRGTEMAVSYNKLWKLLIDRGMKKTELRRQADLGTTTLAKLGKAQPVSMDVMLRICAILNCNISDVMDFVPTDKKEVSDE